MKKYIPLLLILVIVVFVGLFIFLDIPISNPIVIARESNINEEKFNKINNNLYYTTDLIEFKKEEKSTMTSYYKKLSDYLDKNHPSKIFYVENFNRDTLEKDGMIFILYQMVDNAVAADTYLNLDIKNDKIIDNSDEDIEYNMTHLYDNTDKIKANINISEKEIKKIALDAAKENASKMTAGNTIIIKGKYHFRYTKEKKFYYHVILNSNSYVDIDTNGKIIDNYYFNGIYT